MLTLARVVSFALLALSLFTIAHASPASRRAATNAERLARGQGPARPRRLYSGTRTSTSLACFQTGSIGIFPAGTVTSAIRKRSDAIGWLGAYGVSSTLAQAWTYQYTLTSTTSSLLELNHPGTPYRLAGVAIRSGPQVTLGPGNAYYLELQNSRAHTAAGSATATYVYDTYAIGYAQTSIFEIDINGKLSVHWVNPDGSVAAQYLYVSGTGVYVTGDPAALQSQLGSAATLTAVDLFFDVPDTVVS
ncbi:hypothetical protein TRAPUB_2327 [Trametes pubescens]|uniref:Uncharacterized protein n=1 Tax=Trametes pubescens TaxID=154538 RepID=A0A1M2VGT5_TRAPU|nr:hypothetical protein TRAPUB_2327 [Trametes pubescens]